MVQFKFSVIFILAAASISPVVGLPSGKRADDKRAVQPLPVPGPSQHSESTSIGSGSGPHQGNLPVAHSPTLAHATENWRQGVKVNTGGVDPPPGPVNKGKLPEIDVVVPSRASLRNAALAHKAVTKWQQGVPLDATHPIPAASPPTHDPSKPTRPLNVVKKQQQVSPEQGSSGGKTQPVGANPRPAVKRSKTLANPTAAEPPAQGPSKKEKERVIPQPAGARPSVQRSMTMPQTGKDDRKDSGRTGGGSTQPQASTSQSTAQHVEAKKQDGKAETPLFPSQAPEHGDGKSERKASVRSSVATLPDHLKDGKDPSVRDSTGSQTSS